MVEPALFGPLDSLLAPVVEYVVLVLVLANLLTRFLAYRSHVRQAEEGPEAVSRYLPHEASNVLLVLGAFYYLTLHHHGGMVLSVLVLATVITDVFEFEARKIEAREDRAIEAPKGAIFASLLTVGYALFQSLFFLIKGPWDAII